MSDAGAAAGRALGKNAGSSAIHRLSRVDLVWICVALFGLAMIGVIFRAGIEGHNWLSGIEHDSGIYFAAARRVLSGDSYFLDRQLHGPYGIEDGDVLYPPVALWLFAPFAFLPGWLWYAVPLATIGAALVRLRPALWALALMATLAWISPDVWVEVLSGNPLLWVLAALYAAAAWRLPGSFALLKPSLFPVALYGIWRREWWLGAAFIGLLSLPFLGLTIEWARVLGDARNPAGWLYSGREVPLCLTAWVAALGSRSHGSRGTSSSGASASAPGSGCFPSSSS